MGERGAAAAADLYSCTGARAGVSGRDAKLCWSGMAARATLGGGERMGTHLCLLTLPDVGPLEARENVLCVVRVSSHGVFNILANALPDALLLLL